MTADPKSPAAHNLPQTNKRLTALDLGAGYITIINRYAVAPERAEELLALLVQATIETMRYLPGFVAATFRMGVDRTQLVNYAQWRNREAIEARVRILKSRPFYVKPRRSRRVLHRSSTRCGSPWQPQARDARLVPSNSGLELFGFVDQSLVTASPDWLSFPNRNSTPAMGKKTRRT